MYSFTKPLDLILLFTISFVLGAPFQGISPADHELAANRPSMDEHTNLLTKRAATELTVSTAFQRNIVIRPRGFNENDKDEGGHQNRNPVYKREIGSGDGNSNGGGDDSEPESGSEPSPSSIPENIIQIGEAQTYFFTRKLVRKTYFAELLALEALDLNPFISRERAITIAREIVADAIALGTEPRDLDSVLLEAELLELKDYAEQLERAEDEARQPVEGAEEESQSRSEALQGVLQLIDNQSVLLTTDIARKGVLNEDLLYFSVRSWNPYLTDERARTIAQQIRSENLPAE